MWTIVPRELVVVFKLIMCVGRSTEMTMSVLNSLPDDPTSSMARTISTINIFMDIINDRMDDLLSKYSGLSSVTKWMICTVSIHYCHQ